jgi:enediyne biosynthesis protein E4
VRVQTAEGAQMQTVRSGSSYLSQSELAVTFGLGRQESAQRVIVEWPSGVTQDFKNVRYGRYHLSEGAGLRSES